MKVKKELCANVMASEDFPRRQVGGGGSADGCFRGPHVVLHFLIYSPVLRRILLQERCVCLFLFSVPLGNPKSQELSSEGKNSKINSGVRAPREKLWSQQLRSDPPLGLFQENYRETEDGFAFRKPTVGIAAVGSRNSWMLSRLAKFDFFREHRSS